MDHLPKGIIYITLNFLPPLSNPWDWREAVRNLDWTFSISNQHSILKYYYEKTITNNLGIDGIWAIPKSRQGTNTMG
jgi:hypothetical protein